MAANRLRRVHAGVLVHRIHRPAHDPIFFGPSGASPVFRYDSPDGTYKVLYAARSLETAFGETLVRLPAVSYVLSTAVDARVRSELEIVRPLKLYPLLDAGVSAHGLSFADLHGAAYKKTWAVSAEIHDTTAADGILYTSRFDNQPCIALFERASAAIAETAATKIPITHAEARKLAGNFGKTYVEP